MPGAFDPYDEWLGLGPRTGTPNHYELLGLEPGDDDLSRIAQAANRQMARIGPHLEGGQRAIAQRVFAELLTAKRCLLDQSAKDEYDAQLKRHSGPPPSSHGLPLLPPRAHEARRAMLPPAAYEGAEAAQPLSRELPPTTTVGPSALPPPLPPPVDPRLLAAATPAGNADDAGDAGTLTTTTVLHVETDTQTDRMLRARRRAARQRLAIATVAVAVLAAGGYLAMDRGSQPRQTGKLAALERAVEWEPAFPATNAAADTAAGARTDTAATDNATDTATSDGRPAPPTTVPTTTVPATTVPATDAEAEMSSSDSAQPPAAVSDRAPPAMSDTAAAAADRQLERAAAALRQRELSAARRWLDDAAARALDEQRRVRLARLDTAWNDLAIFWNAVVDTARQLKSVDELVIRGRPAVVVEVGEDRLILRAAGARVEARLDRLDSLDTHLVRALAERWELGENDPRARGWALFLALDGPGELGRARAIWRHGHEPSELDAMLAALDEKSP